MRESARLGRNFAAVATAQFVAQLLTFVLSATIARTLGPSSYGLFVFGFAFPSLLLLMVSAGLDEVIAIDVAAEPSRAGSYLTIVAAFRLPLALTAGVVLWISLGVLLDDPFARNVTLVLGVSALVQAYGSTFLAFFRAFEKLQYMALVVLIERTFTIAVAVVLLWRGLGLFEVALTFLAGAVISLTLATTILRRKFTWFSPSVDRPKARGILRKTVPFALGAVISTVIPSTGPVLLTISRGPVATGLFNAGLTLLMMVFSILTLCHVVLLPTLARIRTTSPERFTSILQHTQRFVFALGLPAALGGALYAEQIVTLFFGARFAGGGDPFRILMGAVAISTACIGNGAALAVSGRQPQNLYVGATGALCLVGLSFVLIPPFGPVGAAVAFLAGSAVTGTLGTIVTRRYVARIDLLNALGRPILAGSIMVLVLLLLGPPLWLGVPIGALVYFGSLRAVGGFQKGDWSMLRDAMRGALFRAV